MYAKSFCIFLCLFSASLQKTLQNGEEARVINGLPATIEKYPYTVDYAGCAGAIISDRWILSAAHCQDHTLKRKLRVGSDKRGRGQTVELLKSFRHPKFVAHDYWGVYDLLLLQLKNSIVFNDTVRPVQLPSFDDKESYANSSAKIAAFGRTGAEKSKSKVLLEATLTIASDEECYEKMQHYDHKIMICAKPTNGPSLNNLCKGDSGAALTVDGVAVGILSWGDDECPEDGYTSFVKISSLRQWIRHVSKV